MRLYTIENNNAKAFRLKAKVLNLANGKIKVGTRRADFMVADRVVVELKALIHLEDVHLAQAKNYVKAYRKPVGLLINFGAKSLQFKKIYNPAYHPENPEILQNPDSDRERNH